MATFVELCDGWINMDQVSLIRQSGPLHNRKLHIWWAGRGDEDPMPIGDMDFAIVFDWLRGHAASTVDLDFILRYSSDPTVFPADRVEIEQTNAELARLRAELDAARKRIAELEPPFKPGDVVHLNSLARFRDATVVSTSTTHYVRIAYSYGDGDDLSYTYPASDLLLVSRADESEATDGR